jgi:hypothetical protein
VTIENAEGSTRPPSARRAISNCQLQMLLPFVGSPKGLVCPARMPTIRGVYLPRCYAHAGQHCTCPFEEAPYVASALKPASATSLRYSASRRGENRARRALDAVCRRRLGRAGAAARACSRTGQRWVRTGPMAGVTVTRYDALR